MPPSTYPRIYRLVSLIPPGRVATYGQIAWLANLPGHARLVGYSLHSAATDDLLPWHRVVNAQGRISARSDGPGASVLQRLRLEREGIVFDPSGRIPLDTYRWSPPAWRARQRQPPD